MKLSLGPAIGALTRHVERERTYERDAARDGGNPRSLTSRVSGNRAALRRRDLLLIGAAAVGQLLAATGCAPRGEQSVATPSGRTPSLATATPPVQQPTAPPSTPTVPPPSPTAPATPTLAPTATPVSRASPTAPPSATPPEETATATPVESGTASEPAPVIVRGKPETKIVALTLDAGGNSAEATPTILDTLRDHQVQATIFMTGEWAEAFPDLLQRMVEDGHDLANHTFTHRDLTQLADDEIVAELSRTEATVQQLVGVTTKPFVRAPFGAYDARVLRVLGAEGYQLVHWSLDSGDWRPEVTSDSMVQRVGEQAVAGDIVVFHAYPSKTAQALPAIIEQLQERGLTPGTLRSALA